MKLPKGYKVLKPVHPNAGVEAEYRRKLDAMIAGMQSSYEYWLTAAYRANEPTIAQDAAPPPPKRVTAVEGALIQTKDSSGRVLSMGPNRWWYVYVDGEMLRKRNGVGREWRTRESAEEAGLKAAGKTAVLTEHVLIGNRFDPETLLNLPLATTPAQNLQETLEGLGARWEANFDEAAPKLAQWFATSATGRSEANLKKILKDGGLSVDFQITPVMRDVFNATVAENVGLIKSIASQYHTEVQGMVMRSVSAGRDLAMLTGELEHRFGVTRRRAALISLDQNNKATSDMVRVRQAQFGLQAIWLHSTAGKVPRPTHLANDGKIYDPAVGWFDPDPKVRKRIWPGQLIKCRCVSRSVVKGFS